jgi:hypothetical protein
LPACLLLATFALAPGSRAGVHTPSVHPPPEHGAATRLGPAVSAARPEFEGVDIAAAFDPDKPAFDLLPKGLKARLFQGGDLNVGAELSAVGRLRVKASWRAVTLAVESSWTSWRVSLGYPRRLPLANMVLLDERMEAGMSGVHAAVETTERLGREPVKATGERLRPYARSLRLAGEALSSLSKAEPGWTVGVDLRGKVYQPLGLALEPKLELQASATLVF